MLRLSVIIPTRNESGSIKECLNKVCKVLNEKKISYEVLVMDDDSKDGTKAIVNELSRRNKRIILVNRKFPYGFGLSLRDGIKRAKGRIIVTMMGDLSDDPKFIPAMVKKIDEGYDSVIGSRFVQFGKLYKYPVFKLFSNRLFNVVVGIAFFTSLKDISTNFKAFRASKVKKLRIESKGFEVGAELTLRLLMNGARTFEIPVSWRERDAGTPKFNVRRVFFDYFLLFIRMFKLRYFG